MSERLSNEDEKILLSLIQEHKMVEAVVFVKEKTGMNLKQAKEYVDTKRLNKHIEYSNRTVSNEKKTYEKSYILDRKISALTHDLDKQRKLTKGIGYILLVIIIISLIQFYFLDKTSFFQMMFFGLCVTIIFFLLLTWILVALNRSILEKRINSIKELELSNEFEIKALRNNGTLCFYSIIFGVLLFTLFTHLTTLLKGFTYKSAFEILLLIGLLIFCIYGFFKELKQRKYSLSISGETVKIFYKNNEIDTIKVEDLDSVEFYSTSSRIKDWNPTLRIFDKTEKILVEMTIKREDYHLLTMYFTNYHVLIQDKYNLI